MVMAILVEEGLMPNGMDLVREARLNPTAVANAQPQKHVRVLPIGDGYVVVGLSIEPAISVESGEDGDPSLCAILSVVGGKHSDLVPMVPVKLVIGELAKIKVSDLRGKLEAALKQPEAQ